MTVPWDVPRLRSYEKVSGAEPLDAANEFQPIAGTALANEAPAANGGPRGGGQPAAVGSGRAELVHRICWGSAGRDLLLGESWVLKPFFMCFNKAVLVMRG